ncbi:MAG: hypothetical protein JNL82_29795 [Myxococcales bacterium]|nr:hypothetical protein [Myxococcales bacterium]
MPSKEIVCDPFNGSGTTGIVAVKPDFRDPAPERVLDARERRLVEQAYSLLPGACRHYRHLMAAADIAPGDAASEILLVFVERMRGAAPYDPAKGSLRSYLYLLVRSVLKNRAARRARRVAKLEILGAYLGAYRREGESGELELVWVALLANPPGSPRPAGGYGAPTAGRSYARGAKSGARG